MRQASRLPKRIPAGSKYVLESHGGLVRRHLELPDGRKLRLATRKAIACGAVMPEVSLVPGLAAAADAAPARKRAAAAGRRRAPVPEPA